LLLLRSSGAQAAQRKLYDLGASLGVSQTVLRLIERRDLRDRWLVYVGMLIITVILLAIWWYRT